MRPPSFIRFEAERIVGDTASKLIAGLEISGRVVSCWGRRSRAAHATPALLIRISRARNLHSCTRCSTLGASADRHEALRGHPLALRISEPQPRAWSADATVCQPMATSRFGGGAARRWQHRCPRDPPVAEGNLAVRALVHWISPLFEISESRLICLHGWVIK